MRFSTILAGLVGAAAAQNMSICDKYTTALLTTNNATNQLTVLTLIVNTALIGNYSKINNQNISVTGILNPGTYNGTAVNLLPYFNGDLKSSNRGGPASVNFLDDGGAAPLMKNMPSNGNQTSNQYMLVTHLYEFFGLLAGCTQVGKAGYPAYGGNTNMYQVHQYMDLNPTEMAYFITQVGTAAASFGVTTADVTALGSALTSYFDYRCGPTVAIVPGASPQSQSICQDASCPVYANATCANVMNGTDPMFANGTNFSAPVASPTSGSGSGGAASSSSSKAAGATAYVEAGGILGLAAMVAMAVV